MVMNQKIPATIITGFLGAGKTTLIRRLIENANGRRFALIVNEFGDMGFDGGMLTGCGDEACKDEDIIELTNGCICCTVADEFLPTMETLLSRDPAPDHIIIETSGLALPQPLVAAFGWPTVKSKVTVDSVITVVDAPAVAEGRFAHDHDALQRQRLADQSLDHENPLHELFEDQLSCADLVLLSKTDLLHPVAIEDVAKQVTKEVRQGVETLPVPQNVEGLEALFGIEAAAEDDVEGRHGHHHHHHHDDDAHHHDHHHHDSHDHDAFTSIVVHPGPVTSLDDAKAFVAQFVDTPGVLRVKGHLEVPGKAPIIVQAVGKRVEVYFDHPGAEAKSHLVVIGLQGFDQQALLKLAA